jgi:hypothetical protein
LIISLLSRESRNRTCHSRFYPSATGFEDRVKHQFRSLYVFMNTLFSITS